MFTATTSGGHRFHPEHEAIVTNWVTTMLSLLLWWPTISWAVYYCDFTGSTRGHLQLHDIYIICSGFSEEMSVVPLLFSWQPRHFELSCHSRILNRWQNICILTRFDLRIKPSWINHRRRHTWITGASSSAPVSPLHTVFFNRSWHGREQQQTAPPPPLYGCG